MRRMLAFVLTLLLVFSLLPAFSQPAQAVEKGDVGFFWDSPGQSWGIYATTRALDALATLQEVYNSVPDSVYRVDLEHSIDLAKNYLLSQADDGVWTDGFAGDWAALAVAKAGGDIQPHLASLQADLSHKSFAPDIAQPIATTDLARYLLVAASVYAATPELDAFSDEAHQTLYQAIGARTVAEEVYLDGTRTQGLRFGLPTEGSTLNATTYAIIALGEANKLNLSSQDRMKVVDWLLAARIGRAWGWQPVWAWDEGINYGPPTPDPDSTAAAIRALVLLEPEVDEVEAAIADAREYLKTLQGPDGSITSWGSPSAISTAEVIVALLAKGEDPTTFQQNGKSLVDGLLRLQQTEPYAPPQDPTTPETITVSIEVRGRGETYFSGEVKLSTDKATPLEALKKTGLSYATRGSYVKKIKDLEEQGTAGWKYAVNSVVPAVPADSYDLRDGDEVVWFYASSYLDSGGFEEDIKLEEIKAPTIPEDVTKARGIAAQQALTELVTLAETINWSDKERVPLELVFGTTLDLPGNSDTEWTDEELSYWRDVLSLNKVDVTEKVTLDKEARVGDELGEVTLTLPQGALAENTTLTIKEKEDSERPPLPPTHKYLSHIYSLGPDGISFKEPVTFALKLVVSEDTSASDLVLAYFDTARQVWRPIPAVLDRANGQILAHITHFSDYAVLKRVELPPSFPDVEEGWDWAKDSISLLALRGVVQGNLVGLYEPARAVTRAEFARFLARSLGLEATATNTFSDVPAGAWYEPDVAACVEAGLLIGDGERFHPDAPLTREQAAVILARALPDTAAEGLTFSDAGQISPWARAGVAKAAAAGLIQGVGTGAFAPHLPVSRAQAAVLLVRLGGQAQITK